ncbi:amino acid transporter heavy chain SLC3A1-like isoform X2 [Lineus longissimus]
MASTSTLDSTDATLKSISNSSTGKTNGIGKRLDLIYQQYLVSDSSLPSYSAGSASLGSRTVSTAKTSCNDLPDDGSQGSRPVELIVIRDESSIGSSRSVYGRSNPGFSTDTKEVASKNSSRLTVKEYGYSYESWNWPVIRGACTVFVIATIVALISVAIAFIAILSKACYPEFKWWQGAAFYSVDPRLFSDSDSDYKGDLIGLAARLDYFVVLGTTVIQLDNIFKSYQSVNGQYHVTDYGDLNENVGTLKTFKSFCDAAHNSGMKVILNVPVSQTSDKHQWFTDSRQETGTSSYRDFYIWNDKKPLDRNSSFDAIGNQYFVHFETPGQPALNWDEKRVETALMKQITALWSQGADGIFLSDLNMIQATNKTNRMSEVIRAFRTFMDRDPSDGGDTRKASLMVPSEVLDLIRSANGDVADFMANVDLVNTVVSIEANVTYSLMDFVTSHVIQGTKEPYPWPCWRLGSMKTHKEILIGTLIQLIAFPGTVAIQSGFEIGQPSLETGVLLWKQSSTKALMPYTISAGPESAEKNLEYIQTILNQREKSLGLRFNGMTLNDEFVKGFKFIVTNRTLILQRVHPRSHNYYVLMNYGEANINADYSSILSSAEIVLNMGGSLMGWVDWDKVSLKTGDAVVARQSKWSL